MRIVVALGGHTLLKPGQPMTAENQRDNVRAAAQALAPIANDHELVITHGNGPQVGLLALQAASYGEVEPYPLDVLGAQTEGMIGYMIEQELGNLLPYDRPFATILTMVEVDPNDPALQNPTKPIGPSYSEADAKKLAAEHGWSVALVAKGWRRVVPSPRPQHIFEIRPIKWLLEKNAIVICTGGGGIPTMYHEDGTLGGVEVVIDKDRTSALLAHEVEADFLIMATDVDGVYSAWGTPDATRIESATPAELSAQDFIAGSMRPKVEAACAFVEQSGQRAAIGELSNLERIMARRSGTIIEPQ